MNQNTSGRVPDLDDVIVIANNVNVIFKLD